MWGVHISHHVETLRVWHTGMIKQQRRDATAWKTMVAMVTAMAAVAATTTMAAEIATVMAATTTVAMVMVTAMAVVTTATAATTATTTWKQRRCRRMNHDYNNMMMGLWMAECSIRGPILKVRVLRVGSMKICLRNINQISPETSLKNWLCLRKFRVIFVWYLIMQYLGIPAIQNR